MDLRQLNYFLKVCDEKSFSKAAIKNFITQQGISRSIQELEKELGVQLFDRTTRGVNLSAYGHEIEKDMRQMFAIWGNIVEKIDVLKCDKLNTLRLAAALGTISAISYDLIPAFQERHHEVILEVSELPDNQVDQALSGNLADIVLTIGPVVQEEIEKILLKTHHPRVLVNISNPLAQKDVISYSDLVDEPLFMINDQFKVYHNFTMRCEENGLVPNIVFTTGDIRMVHRMVRQNKGIGLTIDFITEDFQTPYVRDIEFIDSTFTWDVFLAWKIGSQMSPVCQKFIHHIKSYL
ncbi:MAG: hypothetical protein CVU99_10500 [Firmicutes bacterium HGW-Firmicutes-4]|jgi:DNA-binding transcriptional LysR family regulator|nr:MAG: hypothetical protein CVU99_10500 [Firmicutes bacterium HGW-Firmicutes-4]